MSEQDNSEPRSPLGSILTMLTRASTAVGAIIENRAAQLIAIQRREVGRAASVFALAFAAAVFACAAAGFAAVAVLAALGEQHRVIASACIAGGFALLAALAVLLARGRTQPD